MSLPDYVLTWARLPGPARVLAEVRRRRESGRLGARAEVDLGLSQADRVVVGRYLAASWAYTDAPVRVRHLRDGLAVHGVELDELLVALGGPLRDVRAERATAASDREAGLVVLRELLGIGDGEADRVLRRVLAGAESWWDRAIEIRRVVDVASGGEYRLGVLAAELSGDAHALDRTTSLGRAVARFLALRSSVDRAGGEWIWVDPLSDAGLWRDAWASGGVVCDRVSAQVLVLNLPLTGDAAAVALCRATPGEPVWLSLRSLDGAFSLGGGVSEVFVCENPAIVEAAADRFGAGTRPLVCTFGQPTQAAMRLLAGVGGTLRVRADGDVAGHRIVELLLARLPGAARWRMPEDCASYEEELLEDLLADLARPDPRC